MMDRPVLRADLAVIGAGMAGLAAAFFATRRGASTVVIGKSGELAYASGLFDLLGQHPAAATTRLPDPWEGIDALVRDEPGHPYARVPRDDLRDGVQELLAALGDAGLPYWHDGDRNSDVVTPLGTLKRTWALPRSMAAGVSALREGGPCLLVDFDGMKDFSAQHVASALQSTWPALRSARVRFPDTERVPEVAGEVLARAIEIPSLRRRVLDSIGPLLQGARCLGLPAMLGLGRSREVHAGFEAVLGIPVFEIPTAPVSVPGLRLVAAFDRLVRGQGGRTLTGKRVLSASVGQGDGFALEVGDRRAELVVHCKAVVLASGRFFGGGLYADRRRIRETVFGLPVHQPADRTSWYRDKMLDPRGHPVNRAGLEVDSSFRPVDQAGRPVHPTLFAAGSILAHQDWIRSRCGSGLAVGTAYAAVRSFSRLCRGES